MTTSINNSVNNSSAAAESNESKKGFRSSNPNNSEQQPLDLILASEKQVKSGAMMWRVYRKGADGTESKPFYFANPLKALRYAYVLKKKQGGFIPAAIYDKLKAAIEAMPEEERKQAAKKATTAQQAEPAPAPVQEAAPIEEPKPKRKRQSKRTKKEATAA